MTLLLMTALRTSAIIALVAPDELSEISHAQ